MNHILIQGAGWVARQHAVAYQNRPDCRIVAVNDVSVERASRFVEELGLTDVEIYTDLSKVLQHPNVEMVSVCTPQHLH